MEVSVAKRAKSFKIGKDSFKLKLEITKRKKISQSSTQFIVKGKKITIYWSHKQISTDSCCTFMNSYHSEGLYPIYKALLSRGFTKRANQIKTLIDKRMCRIAFYERVEDNKNLPLAKINNVIKLLQKNKVSFIHTEQDYRNGVNEYASGQRCLVHFDRTELKKLMDKNALKKLNPEWAESIPDFKIGSYKFLDFDNSPDYCNIYWSGSISVHYENGVKIKKEKSGPLLGQETLVETY